MPALENKNYFNYGGQGPLPSPSLKAIFSSWEKIQELGPFTNSTWPYIAKEIAKKVNEGTITLSSMWVLITTLKLFSWLSSK